jgi:hypothetical protein
MDIQALVTLWNVTQEHPGTSGARAAAGVLLGLYNGNRFPMDLTDLRLLDGKNLNAALMVIAHDAGRCQQEVHQWLNQISGRKDFGPRFEFLAWDYRFKGRVKSKADLTACAPSQIVLQVPDRPAP